MKMNQEPKYNDTYVNKIRGRATEEQFLKHSTAISERSVTADTHKSRTLVANEKELVNFKLLDKQEMIKKQVSSDIEENLMMQKEELDNQFYVDEYQYKDSKTSHVLHFGINTYRKELDQELKDYNEKQKDFSSKSDNSNNYKLMSQKILLTSHEKFVIDIAIDFLLKSNTKTILIDVFERSKIGSIDSKETHTVVLYKNENGKKVILIDPSNPQFSSHLANFSPDLIEVSYSDKIKIYKPNNKNIGPNPDQYRDCVDIAVKLAFGLNTSSKDYENLKTIISCDVIQSISNNDEINTSILKDIQDKHFVKTPLRVQQKSNIAIEENLYKFSKKLKDNLIDIDNPKPLVEGYINIINKLELQNISNKNALKAVFSICETSCNQKIELLEQQKNTEILELKLLGNIYEDITNSGELYE